MHDYSNLSSDEVSFINELDEINQKIYGIYLSIIEEEVNFKLTRHSLNQYISKIKSYREKEDNIFEKMNITPMKAEKLYYDFKCDEDSDYIFEAIDCNNYDKLFINRLSSRLEPKKNLWQMAVDLLEEGYVKPLSFKVNDPIIMAQLKQDKYLNVLCLDLMKGFLFFNEENIKKNRNRHSYLQILTWVKYNLIFSNYELEEYMLNNNFKIDDLVLIHEYFGEYLGLFSSREDYHGISVDEIIFEIIGRNTIPNKILDEVEGAKVYMMLNNSYLKSILVNLNDEEKVNSFLENFTELLAQERLKKGRREDKVTDTLREFYFEFKKFPVTRSKIKYLSLNGNEGKVN